jgi:hypothetical protein
MFFSPPSFFSHQHSHPVLSSDPDLRLIPLFGDQIKPPQNKKKTQVVKCRQEKAHSNRRRREKKGKEAGAAAAATIQGNVP